MAEEGPGVSGSGKRVGRILDESLCLVCEPRLLFLRLEKGLILRDQSLVVVVLQAPARLSSGEASLDTAFGSDGRVLLALPHGGPLSFQELLLGQNVLEGSVRSHPGHSGPRPDFVHDVQLSLVRLVVFLALEAAWIEENRGGAGQQMLESLLDDLDSILLLPEDDVAALDPGDQSVGRRSRDEIARRLILRLGPVLLLTSKSLIRERLGATSLFLVPVGRVSRVEDNLVLVVIAEGRVVGFPKLVVRRSLL